MVLSGTTAFGDTNVVAAGYQEVLNQVLGPSCVGCHGPRRASKGVRLDSYEAVQAYITPGNAASSLLVQLIESGTMPPNGQPISAENLELLKGWIEGGAAQ